MAGLTTKSVFLERKSYRQRRLRDVARMMPFLGAVLWLLPLAWREGETNGSGTATTLVYIFVVWLILIVLAGAISGFIRPGAEQEPPDTGAR